MKIVFATNNPNKVKEIKALLPDSIEILSLKDISCNEELPENCDTLEDNATQKAYYVYDNYGYNCFADDSGLEIDALEGRPGVYSARYAGPDCVASDNIDKVLDELNGEQNRDACFRTIISLVIDGNEVQFEGSVDGYITSDRQGEKGFGYDPIFIPENSLVSYAQMSINNKNEISHRSKAVKKLIKYLKRKSS
ncbi:MAG: non-canonical purine NTP diphosphatase [Flavobacteriales bacterium]